MKRKLPKIDGYTKIQVLSFVKMKINNNPIWARKACTTIYNQQTKDEKRSHLSIAGRNGCGFGRYDAPLLSDLACKANQNRLTKNDVQQLRRKMPKYAGQLIFCMHVQDDCRTLKDKLNAYYIKKEESSWGGAYKKVQVQGKLHF